VPDEATRRAAAPAAIVVVDDNPAIERFATAVLTRAGHTVLGAASGEEALTHAGSWAGPIDLLVTDVMLAGIDGCMPALARVMEERESEREE
jgi:CheY-like chemotaxis protein